MASRKAVLRLMTERGLLPADEPEAVQIDQKTI